MEHDALYSIVDTRAVEPEPVPKQFCMAGVGAKNVWMVKPKPESEI